MINKTRKFKPTTYNLKKNRDGKDIINIEYTVIGKISTVNNKQIQTTHPLR